MERRTTKTHSEFDLAVAKTTFSKLKKELEGEQISSPFDIYSVEGLRDEHSLRKGTAFATDVFVFGIGAHDDRRVTKVSGLPYWPKERSWPTALDGSPYQFLAQICFLDSRDLTGKLPGDILLIFVPQNDEDWLWEMELIRFEWVTADNHTLINSLPDGVKPYSKSEWYGVLHRTHDYPYSEQMADELEVDQAYDLPIINGTKIGGLPHGIQDQFKYTVDPTTGLPVALPNKNEIAQPKQFLCQLTSIQAAPNVPYPWTNQKKKLSLDFDSTGIYGDENECVFGDMGSIYVFLDPSGKCIATSQCY